MSDLIKREDAIKALSEAFGECEPCDKEETIDIAVTTVKEIPSADRPQGEWIGVEEDWRHQIEFWKCSECDFAVSSMYNYCPNCGARMKGADDEISCR